MVELADPRESRLVLIGTARYEYLSGLPAVANNVERLQEIFVDPDLWGLPGGNCRTAIDSTDPRAVARLVRTCAEEAGPTGMFLVYYAGHGLIDPHDGRLLLALRETEPGVPYESGLPYESLRRAVAGSRAGRRVVILDCCYAGRAAGGMGAEETGTQAVADQALIDQTCLLVSAPRNRKAQAPEGEHFTAFTGEFVRILADGLPDQPATLEIRVVWQETVRALQARGFEAPELRSGNGGEAIPLIRNAARHHRDLAGSVLASAPHITDPDLRQAAILVLRHEPDRGAVGVRLNAPGLELPGSLQAEWRPLLAPPAVVFDGGPVSNREGYGHIAVALLRPGAPAPLRFQPIRDRLGTIALAVDPESVRPELTGLRLFSGYIGWAPKQLEDELDKGALLRTHQPSHLVLSSQPENMWASLLRRT
jgi:putative transcriptional regulator